MSEAASLGQAGKTARPMERESGEHTHRCSATQAAGYLAHHIRADSLLNCRPARFAIRKYVRKRLRTIQSFRAAGQSWLCLRGIPKRHSVFCNGKVGFVTFSQRPVRSRPPKVSLRAGDLERPGKPWTDTWSSQRGPRTCEGSVADGIPGYDSTPPQVGDGVPTAKIVLHYAQRPKQLTVYAHRTLGEDGYPSGDRQRLPVRLVAGRRGGEITSWRSVVPLRPGRVYYLDVHVAYQGTGHCRAGAGSMELALSLET
jgi:hypothetical protein